MEKTNKHLNVIYFVILILIFLMSFIWILAFWLAWASYGDYVIQQSIVNNEEIIWTQEDENKRLEALKPKKVENVPPKEEKVKEVAKEVKAEPKEEVKWNCTSKVRTDLVNHAYKISGWDMKFIWTIASESMFDVWANGDGGMSIGLCQFHKKYQPDNHKAYQEQETDFHKLEFCHEKYNIWKNKWILHKRLYWSNVWENGLKKLEISCK